MKFLQSLFGGNKKNEAIQQMLAQGAKIIDVRSPAEFQSGHIPGSENIPLQMIQTEAGKIKHMNSPIICVCASGMRSGQASKYLKSQGIDSINGGGWSKVNRIIQSGQ